MLCGVDDLLPRRRTLALAQLGREQPLGLSRLAATRVDDSDGEWWRIADGRVAGVPGAEERLARVEALEEGQSAVSDQFVGQGLQFVVVKLERPPGVATVDQLPQTHGHVTDRTP